ncbi:L-ascorbate metabolism protein UlaG, beta-lactamase superfamily [Chitinophaga jiangningensis]|uniref:L-ascorbate metabolism protein UlaG, beta-lactamase superfamily n=1 Tax=Chitinophaga jiangningensis TaxID=1419482 RepID=A0A1M6WJY7_9BACT|nr:MBL fold metallo-hydrolase [Chitinophaga jiangningensis]SHK94070.1 L-ascorbate metabolism protein UlaG, beta-lactamase superfamily [Chitinophaga jiangningensis]
MKHTINVIYLGGPTIILEIAGVRFMTDPTLDPAGEVFNINGKPAYSKTEGPAEVDPGKIDVVLLSHDQHGDNLDHTGRELLKSVPKIFTTRVGADRLQGNAVGLAPWESIVLDERITITSTPARHGPAGSEHLTGDVTGFIVATRELQIYLTGDTVFYEGVQEVAEKFNPKYVFIFAGAARPRGPFNVTMGSNDAIDTAFAFPEATIIPIHFEGWSHYTETGEMLGQSFTALGIANRLKFLKAGVKTQL